MVSELVFTALAEQTRRQLLEVLSTGEMSVGDLAQAITASQPTTSKHLKVLREAGLVQMRADGQRRYYILCREPLDELQQWLQQGGLVTKAPVDNAGAASEVPAQQVGEIAGKPLDEQSLTEQELSAQQHLSRSVGRAATRAADIFANLPKFGRRKE